MLCYAWMDAPWGIYGSTILWEIIASKSLWWQFLGLCRPEQDRKLLQWWFALVNELGNERPLKFGYWNGFWTIGTLKPLCLLSWLSLLTRSTWSWGTLSRGSESLCLWHTWAGGVVLFRTGGDPGSHHEHITRHGVGQRRWSSLTQKQPCTCQTYVCRNHKQSTEWRSFWIIFKTYEKYCFASQNSLLEWEWNWRWWQLLLQCSHRPNPQQPWGLWDIVGRCKTVLNTSRA